METLLQVKNLTKTFGPVLANDNISFDVREGEIHCLLGENGAGKSTLTECIYGYYRPDSGDIFYRGEKVSFQSPNDAIKLGIGMVHQHFVLVEPLSVVENIIVGTPDAKLILNFDEAKKKLTTLCENYQVNLNLDSAIWDLSVGEQQWVEILKALYMGAKLLILDEPTAVLTPQESEKLFKILNQMTSEGISIILISHKLDEVMQSGRVTVMRKGEYIDTVDTREVTKQQLTNMMVGREVNLSVEKDHLQPGKPILEAKNINVLHSWGGNALKDICFTLHEREIIGIAGVAGNGQKELYEALAGVRLIDSGQLLMDGRDICNMSPKEIMEAGIGHIPQDRYSEGLIGEFSICDNLIMGMQRDEQYTHSRGMILDPGKMRKFARKCMEDFEILAPDIDTVTNTLSGGNAQKIILARELWQSSRVLLANHPTRGLDVGVIEYVNKQLLTMRSKGYGILLASDELEDIFNLSDRIAVIFEGEFMGIFDTNEVSYEQVGLLMAGHRESTEIAA